MKGYLLSPLAVSDLSDIWDYSAREWGLRQAVGMHVLFFRATADDFIDVGGADQPTQTTAPTPLP
jgi:plasmid stabilization system protein ParE